MAGTLSVEAAVAFHTDHGVDPQSERKAWARVKAACELAKRQLTASEATRVALPELRVGTRGFGVDQAWSREEAEELWKPLPARLAIPVQRALRDAKLALERIGEVVLVGGGTRMPCVTRLASQLLGRLPNRSMPPDETVALGAWAP